MSHWALRVNSHLHQEHYSQSLCTQWGFSCRDSPQLGNPGQTKITSLLKYSLVNQWVFIGILQEQGRFRGNCDTGNNTPVWVKTPESCSWELSTGLAGSRTWTMWVRAFPLCLAASVAVSLGGGALAKLDQFQRSQAWEVFFFFLTSWVLRASFLLPGEGKLPYNKRIISTLSGHVTSMFTH